MAKHMSTKTTFDEAKALDDAYVMHTYGRLPVEFVSGSGAELVGSDGKIYLDFLAGIGCVSMGHANPVVAEAIRQQLGRVWQVGNYYYVEHRGELARALSELLSTITDEQGHALGSTGTTWKTFFANSGAEANEAMIKMARKYGIETYGPNRYHIVTAKMGFHGRTFGAMSATGQPGNGCQVGYGPMTYGFSYAPYNDLQAFKDACTENTIAVMVEPIQGEGGIHPATQEFMGGLREFCDQNEMLLLIDEVQTGWCRTGKVMSYMHYGIKPDIVSMAKALGGGMPIGAICATSEVAKAFSAGSHGSTFGGHPVSCAAALAQVEELLSRDLAGNAERVGGYLMERLATLPHVREVRGQGLMIGIEFDDAIDAIELKHECVRRHLLLTAIGNRVIRLVPPLIVTRDDCDAACRILEASIETLVG